MRRENRYRVVYAFYMDMLMAIPSTRCCRLSIVAYLHTVGTGVMNLLLCFIAGFHVLVTVIVRSSVLTIRFSLLSGECVRYIQPELLYFYYSQCCMGLISLIAGDTGAGDSPDERLHELSALERSAAEPGVGEPFLTEGTGNLCVTIRTL